MESGAVAINDQDVTLSAVRGMAENVPDATLRRAYVAWKKGKLTENDLPQEMRPLYSEDGINPEFESAFLQVCGEHFSGLHLNPVFVMKIIRSALTTVAPQDLRRIALFFATGDRLKADIIQDSNVNSAFKALSPIIDGGIYARIIPACRDLFERTVSDMLKI